MKVTYEPMDAPEQRQEWDFDPARVRRTEAVLIERRSGHRWDEWVDLVKAEEMDALGVLIWHLMRRQHPALRFEDVPDFYTGEVSVDLDLGELLATRADVVKREEQFTPGQYRAVLAACDAEIEDRKNDGQVELGKANSTASAASTGSPSPPTST